jgi:hypothetical protein
VTLAWTAPAAQGSSAVTGYRVFRGTRAGGGTLLAAVGDVRTYADTSAASGTTYFYTVAAVSSAGQSAPSGEVSARAR